MKKARKREKTDEYAKFKMWSISVPRSIMFMLLLFFCSRTLSILFSFPEHHDVIHSFYWCLFNREFEMSSLRQWNVNFQPIFSVNCHYCRKSVMTRKSSFPLMENLHKFLCPFFHSFIHLSFPRKYFLFFSTIFPYHTVQHQFTEYNRKELSFSLSLCMLLNKYRS